MKFRNIILIIFLFLGTTSAFSINNKQEEKQKINFPDKKIYVYLTFDDGPLRGSQKIDSTILAEKIKISVFLIGEHVIANRSLNNYFKYYEENPYIDEYNHSFTHANNQYEKFYDQTDLAVADILKNNELLKLPYKIVRLPGRNMWRIDGRKKDDIASGSLVADELEKLGYKVCGWDLEWRHKASNGAPVQSVDEIYNEVIHASQTGKTFTPNNVVVLLHDEMFQQNWEESDLKKIIDKLRDNKNIVFEQMRFYPQ